MRSNTQPNRDHGAKNPPYPFRKSNSAYRSAPERPHTAAFRAFAAAKELATTYHPDRPHPERVELIKDPKYWTIEETTYRTWRQQLEMGLKVYPHNVKDDTHAKRALREVETARKVAEQLGTDFPAREILVDDERYWQTEAKAWEEWAREQGGNMDRKSTKDDEGKD